MRVWLFIVNASWLIFEGVVPGRNGYDDQVNSAASSSTTVGTSCHSISIGKDEFRVSSLRMKVLSGTVRFTGGVAMTTK